MCGIRHFKAPKIRAAKICGPKYKRQQYWHYQSQLKHGCAVIGFAADAAMR
jgi:hypothetical protein